MQNVITIACGTVGALPLKLGCFFSTTKLYIDKNVTHGAYSSGDSVGVKKQHYDIMHHQFSDSLFR